MAGNIETMELRPDNKLINPKFESYKLSLENLPQRSKGVEDKVAIITPGDEQYSYLHSHLFTSHNYLYSDPWTPDSVYVIDNNHKVLRYSPTGSTPELVCVWEAGIPVCNSKSYPASVSFPTSDLAVFSNGSGEVVVLETKDRLTSDAWTKVYSVTAETSCLLVEVRVEKSEEPLLHFIFKHIEEVCVLPESFQGLTKNSNFITIIDWLSVEKSCGEVTRNRQIFTEGSVLYSNLDASCSSINVSSDKPVYFLKDSVNPVDISLHAPTEKKEPVYVWVQANDDITVQFKCPESTQRKNVNVKIYTKHISVSVQYSATEQEFTTVLDGDLYGGVDVAESTWSILDNRLEVVLVKVEKGKRWEALVPDDANGEEVMDPELVEKISLQLAHLTSDAPSVRQAGPRVGFNVEMLEDYDVEGDEWRSVVCLHGDLHTPTRQVSTGNMRWLFTTHTQPDSLPCVCLRYDVNGLLWQPSDQWEHVATFNALGYVEASKRDKKFTTCAPDYSYAAIADIRRHIYLYRQPAAVPTELRNRRSGERVGEISKQLVVTLECSDVIVGLKATNQNLFVLTENTLYVVTVN